jgi:hypothetical protein
VRAFAAKIVDGHVASANYAPSSPPFRNGKTENCTNLHGRRVQMCVCVCVCVCVSFASSTRCYALAIWYHSYLVFEWYPPSLPFLCYPSQAPSIPFTHPRQSVTLANAPLNPFMQDRADPLREKENNKTMSCIEPRLSPKKKINS